METKTTITEHFHCKECGRAMGDLGYLPQVDKNYIKVRVFYCPYDALMFCDKETIFQESFWFNIAQGKVLEDKK